MDKKAQSFSIMIIFLLLILIVFAIILVLLNSSQKITGYTISSKQTIGLGNVISGGNELIIENATKEDAQVIVKQNIWQTALIVGGIVLIFFIFCFFNYLKNKK